MLNVFWSLVFVICTDGTCNEWVMDQTATASDCVASMLMFMPDDLDNVEKPKYMLTCEQTQLEVIK